MTDSTTTHAAVDGEPDLTTTVPLTPVPLTPAADCRIRIPLEDGTGVVVPAWLTGVPGLVLRHAAGPGITWSWHLAHGASGQALGQFAHREHAQECAEALRTAADWTRPAYELGTQRGLGRTVATAVRAAAGEFLPRGQVTG